MAAPRVSDNPVVQEHYAAQLGVSAAVAHILQQVNVTPDSPRYLAVVAAVVREFAAASISLGADYYTDLREYANVGGSFRPPVIDPWPEERYAAYIDSGISDLTEHVSRESEIERFARTLAVDAGTQEIFAAAKVDPARPRYARVTRSGACSFCLTLATRGAVYRSEDSGSFRPHTSCQCDVEVSFTKYEPPAHLRQAQQLYSEATADLPRGADRFNAFRRAVYAERNNLR